jgi:hypothetical protein
MKKHLIVFLSVFVLAIMSFASVSNAQDGVGTARGAGEATMPTSPNALYLEGFGNAILYSINYDRFISPNMSVRIGFEYIGLSGGTVDNGDGTTSTESASLMMIPATINFFVGSHDKNGQMGSSKLELGAGLVYANAGASFGGASASGSSIGITGTIGYRFQPSDGGFVFRVGWAPTYLFSPFSYFFPFPGLSLGYSF